MRQVPAADRLLVHLVGDSTAVYRNAWAAFLVVSLAPTLHPRAFEWRTTEGS
jgi:hypothetical protein